MICLLRQWGNSFDQKRLHLDGHMSTELCSCVRHSHIHNCVHLFSHCDCFWLSLSVVKIVYLSVFVGSACTRG